MVGLGYDIHRLAEGESLILAGVDIPSPIGTVAHSDGDVLYHALVDALLGSMGLGDIGEHFPDTDVTWKGAASSLFVHHALTLVNKAGGRLVNVDATLVLQSPKILAYKNIMRENLANVCNLPLNKVNIKATTAEKVGSAGRSESVQAWVICQVDA